MSAPGLIYLQPHINDIMLITMPLKCSSSAGRKSICVDALVSLQYLLQFRNVILKLSGE